MFKRVQSFVRDVIRPYIVNFSNIIKAETSYFSGAINQLKATHDADLATVQTKLDQADAKTTAVRNDMNLHIADKNNPHQVKFTQLVTISSQAAPSTGTPGTIWMQVLEPNQ